MSTENRICLDPIGWVRSPIQKPADDCWGEVVATIEIDPQQYTAECLQGLSEFSHVEIVFHMHLIEPPNIITAARRPRNNPNWPVVGIFAQRAKLRPNRIGATVCRLRRVEGLVLTVEGLDALDGSPVLDVKPFIHQFYPAAEGTRQPRWADELMQNYFRKPTA